MKKEGQTFWTRNIETDQWSDWRWQLKNAIRSVQDLINILGSLPQFDLDLEKLKQITELFEIKLTPYTVQNICDALDSGDQLGADALLASFVPTLDEIGSPDGTVDGIGEEYPASKPVPLVTNFYKNRVLLFVSNVCPSYCRFCFRRRKIGGSVGGVERGTYPVALRKAIQYIRENRQIREVILSGGDPLVLSDGKIFAVLRELRSISHVQILRIDTKVLTTVPQRITTELVDGLRKYKPIYIVGNFLHPVELTSETAAACEALIDAGIPVAAHTALLRGINDDPELMADLMWKMLEIRIRPYYLIQFIPTKWTEHFRVPIAKGVEIMRRLYGHVSGLANPTYIVYLPDGAGKVPACPNYFQRHTDEGYYFENLKKKIVLYRESPDL